MLVARVARGIEWRSFDGIQANIVLTEKEAGISFNLIGGKADYVGFVGKDPMFLNSVKTCFYITGTKESEPSAPAGSVH